MIKRPHFRFGKFVIGTLITTLPIGHPTQVFANTAPSSESPSNRSANSTTTEAATTTVINLPYSTPVITSHRAIDFEIQPSSPAVVPPPPSPAPGDNYAESIAANQTTVAAGSAVTVTLQITDNGQPVTGLSSKVQPVIASGTTSDIKIGSVAETSSGLYQFTVSDTKAETMQINANVTLPGQLSQTTVSGPSIDIEAGSPANIGFTAGSLELHADSSISVSIKVTDAYGNPVPNCPVTITGYPYAYVNQVRYSLGISGPTSITTNSHGSATFDVGNSTYWLSDPPARYTPLYLTTLNAGAVIPLTAWYNDVLT